MNRSRLPPLRVDRDARTPMATQLAHQLAWLIASGELAEGDSLPAVRELAAELEINLHTVRAAYHQLGDDRLVDIGRGRRARVLRFDRSIPRGSVAKIPTSTIGLIIPEFSPFYGPLLRGIEDAARERHSIVFVCTAHEDDRLAQRYLDRLVAKHVDGIIISAQLPPDTPLPPPSLAGLVTIDVPGLTAPGVEFDLEGSQRAATGHLADHDHDRIGFITAPVGLSNVAPKLRGHRRALREADLGSDDDLIAEVADFSVQAGSDGAYRLLDLDRPPTAIAASSDSLAFGAFRAITQRGLRVPDDVALVGNDGTEMASILNPALTTVALPVIEAGRLAVAMLTQQAGGTKVEPARVVLPAELVIRESCGCAPTAWTAPPPSH